MATREEALEEVRAILVEQLGVKPGEVTEESSFTEDLSADSLDLVELIMEIEDRFKLKIPDEHAKRITTVGQALDYVLLDGKLPPETVAEPEPVEEGSLPTAS